MCRAAKAGMLTTSWMRGQLMQYNDGLHAGTKCNPLLLCGLYILTKISVAQTRGKRRAGLLPGEQVIGVIYFELVLHSTRRSKNAWLTASCCFPSYTLSLLSLLPLRWHYCGKGINEFHLNADCSLFTQVARNWTVIVGRLPLCWRMACEYILQ